ncbi:MAG: hypothetical protein H6Q21_1225 [Bacteroidetes bacterium]|nr:hypothetical protein [Bacteroidota bacterium]
MTKHGPFLFLIFCVVTSLNSNAQDKVKSHSSFRDSLDNALDISDWLVAPLLPNRQWITELVWPLFFFIPRIPKKMVPPACPA